MERERLAREEFERSRPFIVKAADAYLELKGDPKLTIKKYASEFGKNIKKLPRLLGSTSVKAAVMSGRLVSRGITSVVTAAKNPAPVLKYAAGAVTSSTTSLMQLMLPSQAVEMDLDQILNELAGDDSIKAAEEETRRQHEEWLRMRSKKPVPGAKQAILHDMRYTSFLPPIKIQWSIPT